MSRRHGFFSLFALRWFVGSLGIWIASGILGGKIDYQNSLKVIIFSGLMLAIVNTLIKPVLVFLTFPFILLSLGLFMIVVNGLLLALVSNLYGPLHIDGFGSAMLAGMIIGLVNYLVVTILESKKEDA
ncbi:MAG: phage holin family protein [Patescibacteria group bacterium]|mgnify:FL=1